MRSLIHPDDRMLEGLPPVLALGFRPFFLLAAFSAAVWLPLWAAVLQGAVSVRSHFDPIAWHAHEMLFGYTMAVVAGFLLTAVRNWTRLPTAHGAPLAGLCLLWIAGRAAVSFGGALPWPLVAAVDAAFLAVVAFVIGRPIVRARSRRNAGIPVLLLAMAGANLVSHLSAAGVLGAAEARAAQRLTLDGVTVLMVLIGGRILPAFTANALGADAVPRRERGALDALGLGLVVALAAVDAIGVGSAPAAWTAGAAGVVHLARMVGWGSHRSAGEPLLWVLHLAWAAIGLALLGRAAPGVVPPSASTHLLTVGGIGLLTLGMMARVSLGHTGRALRAPKSATAAFACMALAAVVRVLTSLGWVGDHARALTISAGAFSVALLLFLLHYGPILVRPRADGRPG